MTLMDRSEAHVGHAAVSDSDSQRTRALGGARKNVSKTGTHMRMPMRLRQTFPSVRLKPSWRSRGHVRRAEVSDCDTHG